MATTEGAWKGKARELKCTVAMDNHEPTRDVMFFTMHEYDTPTVTNGIDMATPHPFEKVRERARHALAFVIDDGKTAVPYYIAGWGASHVVLHPFPVNPNGETRPDNGRVIDYTNWMLGPRTTYHIKVTRPEATDG